MDAAGIGQVFPKRVVAVLAKGREVIDKTLRFFLESARARVAPPILARANRVVLAALIVKPVGNFVTDDGADGACASVSDRWMKCAGKVPKLKAVGSWPSKNGGDRIPPGITILFNSGE